MGRNSNRLRCGRRCALTAAPSCRHGQVVKVRIPKSGQRFESPNRSIEHTKEQLGQTTKKDFALYMLQVEKNPVGPTFGRTIDKLNALGAWRSGHRIRVRHRRYGFESRQGVRFFKGKHCSAVMSMDLICIVCVTFTDKTRHWPKNIFKKHRIEYIKCKCRDPKELI
jgi:hypothetical protein